MNLSRAFAEARRIVGTSLTRSLTVMSVVAATLFITGNVQAQTTRTWDDGAGTSVLTTTTNWSGDLVPASTNATATGRQDALFDGTVGGTLNLTYGSAFGGSFGVGLVLAAGQTSPVNITNSSATQQDIRLVNSTAATVGGIQIASGAGALTIGAAGTANPVRLVLGQGTTGLDFYFRNGSTNTATIEENVTILKGGSQTASLFFNAGNWDVKGVIGTLGNIGLGNVWVSGGSVTLSANNSFDGQFLIAGGTLNFSALNNLGSGSTIVRLGSSAASGVLRYTGASDITISRQMRVGNGTTGSDTGSGTIQNDGTGALTFSNATFNQAGTAAAGRTLTLRGSNAGNNTISGSIVDNSGTGATLSVVKQDAGTWILSGSNSFSGGVNIDLGTLVVGDDNALGTGTVNLRADTAGEVARLRSNGSDRVIANAITFGGAAAAEANYLGGAGSGKLTFNGSVNWGSAEKTYTIDGSTVEFGGTWTGASATNINILAGTDVATSILILNGDRGTAAKEINIANNLTVRVNNNNSFGGDNVEPLRLLGGTRTSVVELENGITLARTLDVGGRDTANANVALRNRSGDNSLAITVGSGGERYNIDSAAGTLTISSVGGLTGTRDLFVTGAGNVVLPNWTSRRDLTMNGTGTLTMGGGSSQTSLTGTATVNSGTLDLAATSAGAALAATGGLVINNGGTVITRDSGNSIGTSTAVTVNTGGLLDVRKNNTIGALSGGGTIRNTTASNYTLTVNNDGGSSTFSGVLEEVTSGTLALTKSGTGTLTLTGANTYDGATTVSAGTLVLGTGGSITSTSDISVGAAGTLRLDGGSVSLGSSRYILNSGVYDINGQTVAAGSYNASPFWAANAKLMNSSATAAVIEGTGDTNTVWINAAGATIETVGDLAIRSIVTDGAGTRGFTKTGAGTLTLTNNANDYDTTAIAAGTLRIGDGGTTGVLGLGAVTNDSALVFNRSDALTVANLISGTGALTKLGAGTLTLTGANSYAGSTAVDVGGLLINGAHSGLGAVTVASAARFGGDGSLAGNLGLAAGALFVFNPSVTLDVAGSVTLDNTFSVASLVNVDGSAINWGSIADGTYTLINTTSTFNNIANFGAGNAFDIGGGRTAYFQNGSLQLVVVPEPGTWAVGAVAAAGLLAFARRLRRQA